MWYNLGKARGAFPGGFQQRWCSVHPVKQHHHPACPSASALPALPATLIPPVFCPQSPCLSLGLGHLWQTPSLPPCLCLRLSTLSTRLNTRHMSLGLRIPLLRWHSRPLASSPGFFAGCSSCPLFPLLPTSECPALSPGVSTEARLKCYQLPAL